MDLAKAVAQVAEAQEAQEAQRHLFDEVVRRLTGARVVVDAARNLVENGSILGMGALQDALKEFDR